MKKVFMLRRLLYLILAALSLYLLLISRSGEVYTVWQYMHPTFIPIFFATTTLLVAIILSPERIEYKVLFIFIHSIISHSFFTIIFPAGNIGFQQNVLGTTRRVFDNISPHGYGGTVENILTRIYNWFRNNNFQVVYSVTFARIFAIDVFWSHLLQAPILWGIFVPTISFLITKTLGGDDKTSALASVLGTAFPLLISLGAISVPNSLGFIFFLASLYFLLKYLTSPQSKYTCLMVMFTFASFLSHFLTGFISFSFLLVALSLKRYKTDKASSPFSAKSLLITTFILSTSILPFALVYQRIFVPIYTSFTMDKIYEYTTTELLGQFLLGDYLYYPPHTILVYMAGPLIAFIWIIYKLYKKHDEKPNKMGICILFLFLGFLMLWIDYRILKIFMTKVPFEEERIWVFRDLLSIPAVAIAINELPTFIRRIALGRAATFLHAHKRALFLIFNISISALLAGWIVSSINYAYPHHSPLQTTSYELEAVKYIDQTTNKNYITICDQWTSYAGQMILGVQNPEAYYFADYDPQGAMLFINMKNNPSPEVMVEAMNYTEAEIAYFIVTKPRLGEEEYNHIIQQAQQNQLQTYKVFSYLGKEKLRVLTKEIG